jgi:molecular chaperone GrpE
MTPEEGDEVGQRIAEEAVKNNAGEQDAAEGEASSEGPVDAAPSTNGAPSEDQAPSGDQAPAEASDAASIESLVTEAREAKERMLRVAADFENFRKRAKREQQDALVRGREEVLRELLPVFDNLERALDAAGTHGAEGAASAIVEGVAMVQRQFADGLARFGLKQFSALGEPFDPNFHEAMAQVQSEQYAPGCVAQEYQKGYLLGERLLRPAMVVVANASSTGSSQPAAEEQGDVGEGEADQAEAVEAEQSAEKPPVDVETQADEGAVSDEEG